LHAKLILCFTNNLFFSLLAKKTLVYAYV
jgi:hypothetical protein